MSSTKRFWRSSACTRCRGAAIQPSRSSRLNVCSPSWRRAEGDLRATLSGLREPGDAVPPAPASDLHALPGLAEVQVCGAAVPSAIGAAAFRIVREALTNVLRHADASSAHVRVRAHADDGRLAPAPAWAGTRKDDGRTADGM
jgi:hypothetical protein